MRGDSAGEGGKPGQRQDGGKAGAENNQRNCSEIIVLSLAGDGNR